LHFSPEHRKGNKEESEVKCGGGEHPVLRTPLYERGIFPLPCGERIKVRGRKIKSLHIERGTRKSAG